MKHLTRYIIGIVLAMAMLGTTMAVAFADENGNQQPGPGAPGHGPRLGGEVTAVDGGSITLRTPNDETLVISTTDETTVRLMETQQEGTLNDIAVGDQVHVHGRPADDGTIEARAIIIEPAGERAGGRVMGVDGSTITVETRDSTTTTILTNDSTVFRQGADAVTLAEVTEGVGITAFGTSEDDGSLTASLVLLRPPRPEGPNGEQQPGQGGPRPEGPNGEQQPGQGGPDGEQRPGPGPRPGPSPEQGNNDEPTDAPTTPDTGEETSTDTATDVYDADEVARDNTLFFSNNQQQSDMAVYLPLMHG